MSLKVYNGLDGETVSLQELTHKYTYMVGDCKKYAYHTVTEVVNGKVAFAALPESVRNSMKEGTAKHRELALYIDSGGFPAHIPYFEGMRSLFSENKKLIMQNFHSEIPFVAIYKGTADEISVGGTPDLWDVENKIIIEYKSFCYSQQWFQKNKLQVQAYLFYLRARKAYLVYADCYFEITQSNEEARIFEIRLQNSHFNKYIIPQSKIIKHWDEKTYDIGKKAFEITEELKDMKKDDEGYEDLRKKRANYQARLAKEGKRIMNLLGHNNIIFVSKDGVDGVRVIAHKVLDKKTNTEKITTRSKFFAEEDMDDFRGY